MGRPRSPKWSHEQLVGLIRLVDELRANEGLSIRQACEVIASYLGNCTPATVRTHYYEAEKMGLRLWVKYLPPRK